MWTVRLASTALVGAGSLIAFLYLMRFLRPRHVLAIVGGDLPSIRAVGASAKLLGTELEASAELESQQDEQAMAIRSGLLELRNRVYALEARTGAGNPERGEAQED